ncbi:MAG TPA: DNA replication/repair protein RecF [Anaeromyxobacteraceae bacterium]|nr:DNA replication/repair protein RecF [Anaeromyxobacteraceae bacterium]
MHVTSLQITDFRNLAEVSVRPSPRTTVLVGDNGQGKTNLLEAIFFLTTLKPLRASRLAELIRFGTQRAVVAAEIEGPGGLRRLAVQVDGAGRTASLDGKVQDRLEGYFEGLAAVCFAPDDLLLVKGSPDGRRRFLDRAAFNRWPAVLGEARDYLRALRSRNAALRTASADVEESFRDPLVRAGARLLVRRRDVVAELAPRVDVAFHQISGAGAPRALIAYRAAGGLDLEGTEAEISERYRSLLSHRTDRDRERGFTSVGPHMDDLALTLSGRPARTYGSQGQQRAFVLALKISEIENIRELLGRPPLLLLDDVSSELDPDKNRFLLAYLRSLDGQAFLTTTDARLLEPAAGEDTLFLRVDAGAVTGMIRQ